MMTMWGFPVVLKSWNYAGWENHEVKLVVYSNAEEVEVIVNGRSLGRKPVCMERPMPDSVSFDTVYEPGTVEAVSYSGGKEVSRDRLVTVGLAAGLRLTVEKSSMKADGHDVSYALIEVVDDNGNTLPDAELSLSAKVRVLNGTEDANVAKLAGFGSGNPVTEDNYTDGETTSFRGRATAVIRAGYRAGKVSLEVTAEGLPPVSTTIEVWGRG